MLIFPSCRLVYRSRSVLPTLLRGQWQLPYAYTPVRACVHLPSPGPAGRSKASAHAVQGDVRGRLRAATGPRTVGSVPKSSRLLHQHQRFGCKRGIRRACPGRWQVYTEYVVYVHRQGPIEGSEINQINSRFPSLQLQPS